MRDLLEKLVNYLAEHLELEPGENAFYYELPDEPPRAICLYEVKSVLPTFPQIDAISRRIQFTARDTGNLRANELAEDMYALMLNDANRELEIPDGFIQLEEDLFVFVDLRSKPLWDKSDQRNRKYFSFEAVITTTK